MIILAFETSCDETACAIVRDGRATLGQALSSQIPVHRRFGGVVPEIASRAHLEALPHILDQVFEESGLGWDQIDAVAATAGPGLLGSLLVGFSSAQALAWAQQKPFLPINHLAGHLYANWLAHPGSLPDSDSISPTPHSPLPNSKFDIPNSTFPLLGLVVSGSHTLLVLMKGHHDFELLGQTLDDAAGEAFDKVARLLDLPYHSGAAISELAAQGDPTRYPLPRALTSHSSLLTSRYDFSFSGLKTAVLRATQEDPDFSKPDLAASFEEAVVDVLITKLRWAAEAHAVRGILTGGGVIANSRLRSRLQSLSSELELPLFIPPIELCTDNASSIAAAAEFLPKNKIPAPKVDPNLVLNNASA